MNFSEHVSIKSPNKITQQLECNVINDAHKEFYVSNEKQYGSQYLDVSSGTLNGSEAYNKMPTREQQEFIDNSQFRNDPLSVSQKGLALLQQDDKLSIDNKPNQCFVSENKSIFDKISPFRENVEKQQIINCEQDNIKYSTFPQKKYRIRPRFKINKLKESQQTNQMIQIESTKYFDQNEKADNFDQNDLQKPKTAFDIDTFQNQSDIRTQSSERVYQMSPKSSQQSKVIKLNDQYNTPSFGHSLKQNEDLIDRDSQIYQNDNYFEQKAQKIFSYSLTPDQSLRNRHSELSTSNTVKQIAGLRHQFKFVNKALKQETPLLEYKEDSSHLLNSQNTCINDNTGDFLKPHEEDNTQSLLKIHFPSEGLMSDKEGSDDQSILDQGVSDEQHIPLSKEIIGNNQIIPHSPNKEDNRILSILSSTQINEDNNNILCILSQSFIEEDSQEVKDIYNPIIIFNEEDELDEQKDITSSEYQDNELKQNNNQKEENTNHLENQIDNNHRENKRNNNILENTINNNHLQNQTSNNHPNQIDNNHLENRIDNNHLENHINNNLLENQKEDIDVLNSKQEEQKNQILHYDNNELELIKNQVELIKKKDELIDQTDLMQQIQELQNNDTIIFKDHDVISNIIQNQIIDLQKTPPKETEKFKFDITYSYGQSLPRLQKRGNRQTSKKQGVFRSGSSFQQAVVEFQEIEPEEGDLKIDEPQIQKISEFSLNVKDKSSQSEEFQRNKDICIEVNKPDDGLNCDTNQHKASLEEEGENEEEQCSVDIDDLNEDQQGVTEVLKKRVGKLDQREIGIGRYFWENVFNIYSDTKLVKKKKEKLQKWRKMIQYAQKQMTQTTILGISGSSQNEDVESACYLGGHYIPSENRVYKLMQLFKSLKKEVFLKALMKGPPMLYRWCAWKIAMEVDFTQFYEIYDKLAEGNIQYRKKQSQDFLQVKINGETEQLEQISAQGQIENKTKIQKEEDSWRENLQQMWKRINRDVERTFPEELFFKDERYANRSMNSLRSVLMAISTYYPKIGYCQGMNFLAAFLLLISGGDELQTFAMMTRMDDKLNIMSLYKDEFPLVNFLNFVFQREFGRRFHKIQRKFDDLKIPEQMWVVQWFQSLFLNSLPLNVVCRFWDYIFQNGSIISIISLSLSLTNSLQHRLSQMQSIDCLAHIVSSLKNCSVLKGEFRNQRFNPKPLLSPLVNFIHNKEDSQHNNQDTLELDPNQIVKDAQSFLIPDKDVISYIKEFKQINFPQKDQPFLQKILMQHSNLLNSPIQSPSLFFKKLPQTIQFFSPISKENKLFI